MLQQNSVTKVCKVQFFFSNKPYYYCPKWNPNKTTWEAKGREETKDYGPAAGAHVGPALATWNKVSTRQSRITCKFSHPFPYISVLLSLTFPFHQSIFWCFSPFLGFMLLQGVWLVVFFSHYYEYAKNIILVLVSLLRKGWSDYAFEPFGLFINSLIKTHIDQTLFHDFRHILWLGSGSVSRLELGTKYLGFHAFNIMCHRRFCWRASLLWPF